MFQYRGRLTVFVCCSTVMLAGCANKESTGSIVGALAGGVAGSLVPKQYRDLAIIGGAILGSYIGSKIGAALDEEDRQALNRRMAVALNKGKDGDAFDWASPKSRSTARMFPTAARSVERNSMVVRAVNVDPTPPLEIIGEVYVAKFDTKLLSGPRSNSKQLGNLKKGERITAMGRVKGEQWIAVGRNDRLIGYAPANSVIAAAGEELPDRTLFAVAPKSAVQQASSNNPTDAHVDQVAVKTPCREISYAINDPQGQQLEAAKVDACKTAEGNWSYSG